ncbi:hypothetical protein AAVH_12272 [Aphelenchoides avenae]|nr:hypothetical protein AAVH_12272 [Aphelenchus avenae]
MTRNFFALLCVLLSVTFTVDAYGYGGCYCGGGYGYGGGYGGGYGMPFGGYGMGYPGMGGFGGYPGMGLGGLGGGIIPFSASISGFLGK